MHMIYVQTTSHEENCEFSAHPLLPVPEESQITPMASLRSLVSRRQRKALRQQVITELYLWKLFHTLTQHSTRQELNTRETLLAKFR